MSEKAALFHNSEIAEKIMKMNDPIHMKRAAYSKMIKGYNHDDWLQAAPKVLHKGLTAKFSQNPPLKQYLESTKPHKLGEATDDAFWGIGMKLGHPHVHKFDQWKKNLMGSTLQEVRNELCD